MTQTIPAFVKQAGIGALTAVLVAGVSHGALAAAFQLKEQSAEGVGNAFAGSTAKALDMSTIFFNPAGMTSINKSGFEGHVSFISPNTSVTVNSATNTNSPGGITSTEGAGDPGKDAYVPVMYGMWSVNDDLKLGIGITAPFGLRTEYNEGWVGRFSAIKSDLKVVNVQPTVAYRVTDWFSVGLGIQGEVATAELTNAVNSVAGESLVGLRSEQDWSFGYSLGVMFEPIKNTRIGLSYRSRVEHDLEGAISFSNPLLAPQNSDASAEIVLPDIASIGIYSEVTPQLALMVDASWTNWSTFDELRIQSENPATSSVVPQNYQDSYFVAVGATYKPIDGLSLQIGGAYDKTPTQDEFRTARIPDASRYWIAGGVGYTLNDWLSLNAGYTHIFLDNTTVNETSTSAAGGTTTLNASYESSIDIVSVSGKVRF